MDDVGNTYVINGISFHYRAEKQKEKYESILDNYNKIFGKCVDPRTAAIFPENDENFDESQEEVDDQYSY